MLVFEDTKTAQECASAMKNIFDKAVGIKPRLEIGSRRERRCLAPREAIPGSGNSTCALRHFQERMPCGLFVPDVP
jgi:hypothetical protein